MKTKYYILLIIASLTFIVSCDKIEEPFIIEHEGEEEEEVVTITNNRKVLILDFTGHKCGNCPGAHRTINDLIDIYGDTIVPVAIHCTWYALPSGTETTEPFHYDFRTDVGDYLGGRHPDYGFYGEIYLPVGLVNNLAADELKTHNAWGTKVAEYVGTTSDYLIDIDPSLSNSTINCDINVNTNVANSRKIGLTVYILEDNIIQWQTDYDQTPSEIENYEHKHVLRAGMNGPFGEIIKDNTDLTSIGDTITTNSYSLDAGDDWVIDNCSIVAFVYDDDTKEVLQAEMVHLHE